jgi:hypothetical protein
MSTKAFARSGIAFALLIVAACSETLAPKLERIQSQIVNALTCDVTWTGGGGDGQWQTPSNWSTLALPAPTQSVCITADVPTMVTVRWDAYARNITIGAPGNAMKQTLVLEGFVAFGARTNLTVGEQIENYSELVMHGTGHNPAAVQLTVGTIVNHAGAAFRSLSRDFDASGGPLTHWVTADVINDGTLDWRTSVEMRGTYTNRGVANLQANWRPWEWYYFYNLPNGAWIQDGGSLIVDGLFTITNGALRLENGTIAGASAEGPILDGGTFTIAGGSNASGNVTLRNTVAMSGDVPVGLTVIAAGHAYSTTGINFATSVTAAGGFVNRGTIRLISTGHAGGTPSAFGVTSGMIDNYGRIESHVGGGDKGRQINASLTNRAGAVVDIRTLTDFNKAGAAYENHGTITVTPSTFVTVNGAPGFLQNGALTLGTDAQWKQDGGSFRFAGGAITGRPWLAGIALDIPAGSPGTGTLLLTHTSTIAGDVPAAVKLHVEQWRGGSTGFSFDGILNAAASFTNFGTIVLGNPGFNPNPARMVMLNGSTLTNKGRFETVFDPAGGHRYVVGNFTNEGTLQLDNWTQFLGGTVRSLAPAVVSMGSQGQGLFDLQPGATLVASGSWPLQLVNRGSLHIGAPASAASLNLREYGGTNTSSITMDIGGSPGAPGVDFDKLSMTGPMTIGNGVMHVKALGACVDGGKSYDVISYSHPSGNFGGFTGLDLGNGRMVAPEQLSNGYRLKVLGPVCPPPDATPPVIAPNVSGTLGLAGWYTSDVTVSWTVTDAESPVTATTGCGDVSLTSDNAGVTYTCVATSGGGTATQSVTVKRDATPPVITTSQSPMPNAHGWNNTNVTAFFSATDAMSGLEGAADRQSTFTGEGIAMNFGGRYFDKAGNKAEALIYASIDRTPPVVSATRAPAANANGWNNSDVTATYSATDALSGLDGATSATELFASEGENQAGSKVFTDKAGNTATANIGGISIDKIAPTVTVTRSPLPDATGWNNTDVTATWTATDALSGIDGSSSATHLFNTDGAGQSATRSFSDRAGNGASATIDNVNIDKTPAPPPPPPPPTTLTPVCSVTPNEIWPPNNKMVSVRATIGGTGVTSFKLRSVVNNESGSADVTGWTLGTADVDGSVLAKRNGGGSGRTYTLTYDVFGANGATGSCAMTVRVPHDQRK